MTIRRYQRKSLFYAKRMNDVHHWSFYLFIQFPKPFLMCYVRHVMRVIGIQLPIVFFNSLKSFGNSFYYFTRSPFFHWKLHSILICNKKLLMRNTNFWFFVLKDIFQQFMCKLWSIYCWNIKIANSNFYNRVCYHNCLNNAKSTW